MLKKTIYALFKWGLGVGLCFACVYLFGGKDIVRLMTDLEAVREGVGAMRWVVVMIPVVSVWTFILDGIYIGLTSTRRMFVTTFAATVVFGMMCVFGLNVWGNIALWVAFASYLFVRGAGLLLQLPRTVSG